MRDCCCSNTDIEEDTGDTALVADIIQGGLLGMRYREVAGEGNGKHTRIRWKLRWKPGTSSSPGVRSSPVRWLGGPGCLSALFRAQIHSYLIIYLL